MDLLRSLVDETGLSMLVATHDASLLADADVAWELRDGLLDTGVLAPRWSGDVDRSRTISQSTTLPAPVVDEHAAFRPAPAGDDLVHGPVDHPRHVGGSSIVAPGQEDDTDAPHPPLRWGPDGEPLED